MNHKNRPKNRIINLLERLIITNGKKEANVQK